MGTIGKILKLTALIFLITKLMVYLSTILACPATFISSTVTAQLSKLVDKEEQFVCLSIPAFVFWSCLLGQMNFSLQRPRYIVDLAYY